MEGERISQLRRTKGMSQEALGAELGVSRQAISKWESGRATPEVEKLIAMSRLFGVSVGYLLGIEEEVLDRQSGCSATNDGKDETAARDQAIEETVLKYFAALPGEKRSGTHLKHLIAFCLVAVFLAAAVTASYIGLNNKIIALKTQYAAIESEIGGVTDSVSRQMEHMAGKIEDILESQESLLASYDCHLTDYDPVNNRVIFAVSAVPKTVTEGMTAEFIVISADESGSFTGEYDGYGGFQATIDCGVTDDIAISVTLLSDGVRETQTLASYSNLQTLVLPRFGTTFDESNLSHASTRDSEGNPATIDELRVLLYEYEPDAYSTESIKLVPARIASTEGYILINGERVCEGELVTDESGAGEPAPAKPVGLQNVFQLIFRDFALDVEPMDEILIVLTVTDIYARSYEHHVAGYVVDPSGYLEKLPEPDGKGIRPLQ